MDLDLTTPEGVVALMESSQCSSDWNANCDRVKAANARDGRPDYPSFWYEKIIQSGLLRRVGLKWGDPHADAIKISTVDESGNIVTKIYD